MKAKEGEEKTCFEQTVANSPGLDKPASKKKLRSSSNPHAPATGPGNLPVNRVFFFGFLSNQIKKKSTIIKNQIEISYIF